MTEPGDSKGVEVKKGPLQWSCDLSLRKLAHVTQDVGKPKNIICLLFISSCLCIHLEWVSYFLKSIERFLSLNTNSLYVSSLSEHGHVCPTSDNGKGALALQALCSRTPAYNHFKTINCINLNGQTGLHGIETNL